MALPPVAGSEPQPVDDQTAPRLPEGQLRQRLATGRRALSRSQNEHRAMHSADRRMNIEPCTQTPLQRLIEERTYEACFVSFQFPFVVHHTRINTTCTCRRRLSGSTASGQIAPRAQARRPSPSRCRPRRRRSSPRLCEAGGEIYWIGVISVLNKNESRCKLISDSLSV
jgi:hypothetical protein